MQLLEQISQVAADAKAVALTAYRKLVIRVARNDASDEVDATEAIDILRDVQKTHGELSGDVELFKQRQRWEADIVALEEARAEWAAAEPRIVELEKKCKEVIKQVTAKIDAELAELRPKESRCAQLARAAGNARRKLMETTDLSDEREQFRCDVLKPAAQRLQQAKENRARTRDHIRELENRLRNETSPDAIIGRNSNHATIETDIKHAKIRLTEREERLKTAEQELQQANARMDELTAASLKA